MGCHDVLYTVEYMSNTHQVLILYEPPLSSAYESVLKIKYWWTYVLALFPMTANIAKIK